jgi:hypothetical protein
MKIIIPDNWLGEKIDGSIERVLQSNPAAPPQPENTATASYQIQNPREYIQIPQFNLAIAQRETHQGLDMYNALETLAQEGRKMPSPAQFMQHWLNVKEAASGGRNLLYADRTPVEQNSAQDLWNYLSSKGRSSWNGQICWTWLNALFRNENNEWYLETDLKVNTDAQGNKTLQGNRTKLAPATLRNDAWVNLEFTDQGLATSQSSLNGYNQGQNIYFYHPRNGAVAGFYADSVGAYLGCGGYPSYAGSSLGVFACAEGTAQNFGGRR